MFVNEFPALSETFVLNQITGLIDLGHDVTVLATRPRGEALAHADVRDYGLRALTVYQGMPRSRLTRLWHLPRLLGQARRSDGQSPLALLNAFAYGREASSLNLLHWAARLRHLGAFDVVHCHFGIVGRVAAILREAGALHGQLAVSFHGVDMSASLVRSPHLYRRLFEQGELFMPVSDYWRGRLVELGCDPAKIRVHRMGVDPLRFPFRLRRRKATEPITILSIGRLVEKKGIEYGLRAVAALADLRMPIRYVIVGDGPLRGGLSLLARELGIAHSVEFAGWRTQDEIAAQMRSSDVLLAPSVTARGGDQEGIPVTLMEAMASGLPVISSRHSGIPELIHDGHEGRLCAERDVAGLSAALRDITGDPAHAMHLALAARAKIESGYDIWTLNRQLEQSYYDLVGRRS